MLLCSTSIDTRLSQCENAEYCMVLTVDGIVTFVRLEHPEKAYPPIISIFGGIVIDVRPVHNLNALKLIDAIVVGIVNEVKNFDEAVAIALKFVLENPDTVLLITADHETGDMEFRKNWESSEITDNRVKA